MFRYEEEVARNLTDLPANLFITIGELENPRDRDIDNDMVEQSIRFARILRSRHYPSLHQELMMIPNADHMQARPTAVMKGIYWMFESGKGVAVTR